MAARQSVLSKEEHARRGTAIYEKHIRDQVEKGNYGKVVAIDVDTGEFAVDEEPLPAAEKLRSRRPNGQIRFVRHGHRGPPRFCHARGGGAP